MESKKNRCFFLIAFSWLLLASCNFTEEKEIAVHFNRFDKAVFSKSIADLRKNYPDFAPFYLERIIEVGSPTDTLAETFLQKFIATYKGNAYDSLQNIFPNLERQEKVLGKALARYKKLFPKDSLPQFFVHFSGFNESIVRTSTHISVSLENYMGKSSFYDKLGIYQYLRAGMFPNKIPRDIMKMLLLEKISPQKTTDNLLGAMIYQGKLLYGLHEVFPDEDIEFLLDYSEEQVKWCEENEPVMWSFIIEHKHLFSSDYRTIRPYIEPSPFTKGFPADSPGKTGAWIGYRIVQEYMKNAESTLVELFQNTAYQKILQESGYNPEL